MPAAVPSPARQRRGGGGVSSGGTIKSHSGYPLPIVDKMLELTSMIDYSTLRPKQDTTKVWDWFAQQTNIRVRPEVVKDADRASIIFASRDFPDFYMNGANNALLIRAIEDGDILPLDDLLKQHAPTWDKFFKDNPIARNYCSYNGKIYFLPSLNYAEYDRDLRDQWLITQSWLDELGLKIPTTTEEFKAAMLAIKNNAGKGSIPRNVLPFYYFFDNYIGGQFDVYSSFGVTVTNADYLAVENGRVLYQAVNPDIKAPLKYLQELYREGLTPPECFTDDWNTYLSKISAMPPVIGSYGSYANRVPAVQAPMPPLQSPNGKKPAMRRQAYVPQAYHFAIFANNPDPVATIKFCEYIACDLEANMNTSRGMKDVLWKFEPDGKVSVIFWEESPDLMSANADVLGPHNSFIVFWDQNFYAKNFLDKDKFVERSRSWAYDNVYKNYRGPEGSVYVAGSLSQDEEELMRVYNTDLTNLRKQTFARWITTNANIDAEWDAYAAGMSQLHINEFLALKQKAYDAMTK
jgi:putative aldouronate transport system substrate-binding protein